MAEKNLEEMREAVEAIREKMAAAAREAGRDPAEVQLCAACKTRTADTVAASAALAIDVFGENHVQELCANYDAGAYCGKPSHFIGHLQTNKIKKVLGRASLIQSVDSEHLLAAIEKEAAKAGIVQDVLLEVNIGGEESKSGVSPEQLWPLLDAAAAEEHIRVKGLMAIPPVNDDDAQNRRYLAQVYKLFVQAGERGYQNVKMETLSMGMSGDFENAIREEREIIVRNNRPCPLRHCFAMPPLPLGELDAKRPERASQLEKLEESCKKSTTPQCGTPAAAPSSGAFCPIWQNTKRPCSSTCSVRR